MSNVQVKRFIPKMFKPLEMKPAIDLDFYWNECKIKPVAICFTKKSFRHSWYYRFKNVERMNNYIKKTIDNRQEHQKTVKERRQKRFAPHSLKVGDYLYASWGYDQTNIDFFQVIRLIGKNKIVVQGCSNKITEDKAKYNHYVVPGDNTGNSWTRGKDNHELIKTVNGERNSISLSSFAFAHKWDGIPKSETDSLYGH